VISAASCYEHARKQKEKGVPWGGVRMLRRCEAGKETSGCEIRGGRRAGDVGWWRDVGKVHVTSGRNRHWEWRPDAGDAEDEKTMSDASGRGARTADAGSIFADACSPPII